MRYIIAPAGVGAGDIVSSRSDAPIKPGMTKQMKDMPTGTTMHNIELRPGKGAVMCRAAGASATLIKNGEDGRSLIALPSGTELSFFSAPWCTHMNEQKVGVHYTTLSRTQAKTGNE